jgi:DNA repair protein RecO (recombination protein O)
MTAGAMTEVIDAVAQEGEHSARAFLLLQRSLRTLEEGPAHPDLLTAFLLKVADFVGVAPALDSCAGCGRTEGLERFAFAAGGTLCERCRTGGAVALRDGLTGYLAALASAPIDDLPEGDPALTGDALGVIRRFLEYHLDRRLVATGRPE